MEMDVNYITDNTAILMATCNGEKFIKEQLDSILLQSYQNWTLFIHDDGSTDKTAEILRETQKEHSDKIILIEAPPTGGVKENFFFLLSHVDAPYYMFSDQDDIWQSNKIEKTIAEMKKHEERRRVPILVFSDLCVVDENKKVISKSMSKYQLLNMKRNKVVDFLAMNTITGCTVMINRKLASLAIETPSLSQVIMHDWYLALIAAEYGQIVCINEPLILYRQHNANTIGAKKMGISHIKFCINHIYEIKESIQATRNQAMVLSSRYNLDSRHVISRYANLSKKNKFYRLYFYLTNHITKCGVLRTIGLYLLG